MDEEKPDEGSIEELPPEDTSVEETDDGGAIVNLDEEKSEVSSNVDFHRNLADELSETILEKIGLDLSEKIEMDKKSRENRDKQYEDGIRRTGLGNDAPGGADFPGASRVVHPMLTKACIDFSSRVVPELMPPGGPVRTFIPGKTTKDRVAKSERKVAYMNWQFKTQMADFRPQLEQLATQLPLGGSQYLRIIPDSMRKNRPVPIFVPIDDVYLPFSAASFYTAERVTYAEDITQSEFESRVRQGIYRDLTLSSSAMIPEASKSETATQKVEGKEPEPINQDGNKRVFEVMITLDIEDEELKGENGTEDPVPYLVGLDKDTNRVLSIVRNWERDDEEHRVMYWMVEFPFVPWRGAYAIGLSHMIAGLSAAATGALRALLDTAHTNNIPTLLKLKGTNFSGQSQEMSPTGVTEVQGGLMGTDDIRKLVMTVPFNQPSPVLFELLGFLVGEGDSVVQTAFKDLAEHAGDLPVGTTLALIEQGLKVFSSIYQRLWTSMDNVIRIVHRINRMYLTDDEVKDDTGEFLAYRSDFQDPVDVIPTADQEIFSEVQRFAQMQMVAQRAQAFPQLYDVRKVELMILKRSKIPDAESLLLPAPEPKPLNAVNENLSLTLGRPVMAFPDQDHLAHIQVLLDFMTSPMLGFLPIIAPTFLPAALEHLKEHIVMWYVATFYDKCNEAMAEMKLEDVFEHKDPETQKKLDELLATASPDVIKDAAEHFAKIPPIIAQAQQIIQQFSQPQPMDPAQALLQAKDMETKSREKTAALAAQAKSQGEDKKLSADQQKAAVQQMGETERTRTQQEGEVTRTQITQQAENQRSAEDNASHERISTEDNATAMAIAAGEIAHGHKSNLTTGESIDKNPSAGN